MRVGPHYIKYRFDLVPIIGAHRNSMSCSIEECGSAASSPYFEADSPKFMTYMAWERSSLRACSTAGYSPPESTFKALKNCNTNKNHCVKRKHLMWALTLAVKRHRTVVVGYSMERQVSSNRGRTLNERRGAAPRGGRGAGDAGALYIVQPRQRITAL